MEMDGDAEGKTDQGFLDWDDDWDDERERVAEALTQHFLDGRLSSDEYSERMDTAYIVPAGEALEAVLGDLPPIAEVRARPQPSRPW